MRIPLLPTIMVVLAVPVLIALGFWQLDRLEWKEDILGELAERPALPRIDLDEPGAAPDNFRRAAITCRAIGRPQPVSGRSPDGRTGYSFRIPCQSTISDAAVLLDIGWAPRPDAVETTVLRGRYEGLLIDRLREVGSGADRFVLIAARPPLPQLQPSAIPTVGEIPNSHMSYAVQWFGFAGVLIVIYALYVVQWRKAKAPGPGRTSPPPKASPPNSPDRDAPRQ